MIEPSVTLMTIVDVLMVGTCSFALWRLHSYRKEKFSQIAGSGFYLVVFGLVLICLFYVADFATMYALPFFIPAVNTMALMKVLHQVYMWFFIPFGVGSIVAGCIKNILKVSMLAREAQNREARFADIAEVASDWIWEMDGNLRMTYMSDRVIPPFLMGSACRITRLFSIS